MNLHDLIKELREDNHSKIVLARRRRPGRPALDPQRPDRAGVGPHAEPGRPGARGGVRPERAGAAGHHARQRPRPPGPVRLRPAPVPHRPGHPRSAGHQLRDRPARRGGARQLLHGGRRRHHHATAAPAGRRPSAASPCASACRRSRCPASRSSSSRCASTASSSCFRGDGLGDAVNDTDPQARRPRSPAGQGRGRRLAQDGRGGQPLSSPRPLASSRTRPPTNMVTLRGFARYPQIATLQDVYGLKAAALAVYPMYKGLARLVGMDVVDAGSTLGDQMANARGGSGTATTSSSCTTSTPTAPARTATSRPRSR